MQTNPLDGLHDVIAPSEVAWWPLAPIWWLIIVFLVALLVVGLVLLYKNLQFKKAKKQAIKMSQNVAKDDAQALHIILKRLTRHYYNSQLASQPLAQWSESLSKLCGDTFSYDELMPLYQQQNNNAELAAKLRNAIHNFKLKESINV
tara:strand:- start:2863 stop:3303 length:441 start_codon:yes stop_codon:yes gene_type:complete